MIEMNILGYIGKDCQSSTHNNRIVINFTVCVTRLGKDREPQTEWVQCSYWCDHGKDAITNYLKKGQQVLCKGIPSTGSYTNKEGVQVCILKLLCNSIHLCGGKKTENSPALPSVPVVAPPVKISDLDDMPF